MQKLNSSSLFGFLGLGRSMFGLLAMATLLMMAEKMTERFLPIYLIALGGGPLAIGILQGLTNLLGAVYSLPAGYLTDKIGAKRALLVFNIMAITGYVIVIAAPHWLVAIGGAVLFTAWSAISLPATMQLVAKIMPTNKRTMGISLHSLVRRFPMAIGPIVGGLLIASYGETNGIRIGFALAILLAVFGIVLQSKLINENETRQHQDSFFKNIRILFSQMSPALRKLLISDTLIRFCEQIPYAFIVVWCMKVIAAPVTAFEFGILTSIEMATAVLIYIPVAYFADRSSKEPFVAATFSFFTLFPLALLYCNSFWPLVLAFILRGLKEFGEPTRKALIMDLCPADRRASMFGLYYFIRDTIVSIAAFCGAIIWGVSPALNLISAAAAGLCGTIFYVLAFGEKE